ncbi:MAG: hypothetical protein ACFCVE_08790 [Phycisphaerae bacterium]
MLTEYQSDRLLLGLATLLAGLVLYATALIFDLPPHTGEAASLLADAGVGGLVALAVGLLLACALAAGPAAYVRFDAGLGCVAAALVVVAGRLGTAGGQYRGADPGVYLTMALETVLLFVFLAGGWWLVTFVAARFGRADASLDLVRGGRRKKASVVKDEPLDQKLLAVAVNVATMTVLLMFILKSDARGQAILCVGIASFCGALVAHQFVPTRPSGWFWCAPCVAGVAAYVVGYLQASPEFMQLGIPAGFFGALAHAAPLDWASAGVAGSMIGYWTSVRWKLNEQDEARPTGAITTSV